MHCHKTSSKACKIIKIDMETRIIVNYFLDFFEYILILVGFLFQVITNLVSLLHEHKKDTKTHVFLSTQLSLIMSSANLVYDCSHRDLDQACRNCDVSYDSCRSLDCPRLYLRTEAKYDAGQIEVANQILKDL